ncbi:(SSU ribosomal protein S18P)-alanine acetyltransferase [Oscillatoria nigro-viridis PCC 7112]|uniref:(SSU ribosomal protein S18P)-alanine acetyltransferase n=1 Tax=Phormidium nigroviride PCC 7112 TaxID=179408 RepID=K9VG75_9CYAN|nr:ribosomal protein S18-alanine N-acetyltransferase [Oscillatoria nigro-viridis]AFZ07078.1 (SSU ribosomal protein S18P)-alanine acetyltransferase [Oscillatoria nigro-viridis PCC 7112]
MRFLQIKHLAAEHLNSAVELDRLCFGGLWAIEGYRRELDSPNSDLLGLWTWETDDCESAQNRAGTGAPPLQIPPTLIGIGCLWAILEEAHIIMLAIHPQFQRQGLGQALLLALLKSARNRQLERATLEVRDSNLAAVSLYKKFGFKEAGRRKRYYEDTGEDALVMWRSGLEKPEFQRYLAVEKVQMCDRLNQKNWHLAIDNFELRA